MNEHVTIGPNWALVKANKRQVTSDREPSERDTKKIKIAPFSS